MAADDANDNDDATDNLDADDSMIVDFSIDKECMPPVSKRQKLLHHFVSKKRKQLEMPRPSSDTIKRVKIQPPKRDRLEDFPSNISKRRKVQEYYSNTKDHIQNSHGADTMQFQHEARTKVRDDDNDLKVAELDKAVLKREVLMKKDADEKLQLEQRVRDRILKHRTNESVKERLAELKARVQPRIQEEVWHRAAGKSIAEMLTEFCGIRCSDRSQQSLKRAFKRALAMLHPDRMIKKPLEEIVEAEEIYKLLQPIYCEL